MSALWTAANVFFPDLFKQLPHSEPGIPLLKLLVSLELKNKLQIFGFHAIVKKAVITDFLETGWKHMHKEAPDKLLITEGNRTTRITWFPACRKKWVLSEHLTGTGHSNGIGIFP